MIDTTLFYNVFEQNDTVPHPFMDGMSDIPDTLVYQRLTALCHDNHLQWSWVHKDSGRFQNGNPHFEGELIIEQRDQNGNVVDRLIRSGSAEGPHPGFGVSGCGTMALKNAALRGLQMAEFLYQGETAAAAPQNNNSGYNGGANNNPGPTHGNGTTGYQNQHGQNNGSSNASGNSNGGYNRNRPFTPRNQGGGYNRNNGGGSSKRPWSELRDEYEVKSGQHQGTKYSQLPIELLQQWASGNSPNKYALQELEFRGVNSGGFPGNNFGNNPGYNQN